MRSLSTALALLAAGYAVEIASRWQVFEIEPQRGHVVSHPTWLDNDGAFYRMTVLSLLEDGNLDLRNQYAQAQVYQASTNVSLGARGELYPKHPLLLPLLSAPFYLLAGDKGLLAFNVLALLALCAAMWALARRVCSEAAALVVTFAFGYFTSLRPAAYNFSPDVLATLLIAGAVLALVRERPGWAGALLGVALWARWTNAVFLPLGLGFALFRGRASALRFSLAASLPALALLAMNQHMFGSLWLTPYDRVALLGPAGRVSLAPSHRTLFAWPSLATLWAQLADPSLGLFTSSPPLLLAIPGFVLLWRRARKEAALAGAFSLAQFAFFAPYQEWRASQHGPRFLMAVVALGVMPAAVIVDRALAAIRPARA